MPEAVRPSSTNTVPKPATNSGGSDDALGVRTRAALEHRDVETGHDRGGSRAPAVTHGERNDTTAAQRSEVGQPLTLMRDPSASNAAMPHCADFAAGHRSSGRSVGERGVA
jgi:hypothetical protein